jgi:DNA-binding GntR family transcriptional regulator
MLLISVVGLSMTGCAKAAKDTSGFALEHTIEVDLPFETAWQVVKDVMQDEGLYLYTRDKRGTFVAFSEPQRRPFKTRRVQYTAELERISDTETSIYIETIRQKYGVTLMTYPDWHDRQTVDAATTEQLITSIEAWAANGGVRPGDSDMAEEDSTLEADPMPAGPVDTTDDDPADPMDDGLEVNDAV